MPGEPRETRSRPWAEPKQEPDLSLPLLNPLNKPRSLPSLQPQVGDGDLETLQALTQEAWPAHPGLWVKNKCVRNTGLLPGAHYLCTPGDPMLKTTMKKHPGPKGGSDLSVHGQRSG